MDPPLGVTFYSLLTAKVARDLIKPSFVTKEAPGWEAVLSSFDTKSGPNPLKTPF